MSEPEKPKVKVGLTVSAKEFEALEFVKTIHGDHYEGASSVLNDYSVSQCVALHEKAKEAVAA